MKNEELEAGFRKLNLKKEVVDEIMQHWKFASIDRMFESGTLLLHGLTGLNIHAKCDKLYFRSVDKEGKDRWFTFDFMRLIEMIDDPQRTDGDVFESRMINQQPAVEQE